MRNQIGSLQIKRANVNKSRNKSEGEKLRAWLKDTVKLEEYFEMFERNGFDSLDAIKLVTMEVLNMIGIDKIGHKMVLLRHIAKLNVNNANEGNDSSYL